MGNICRSPLAEGVMRARIKNEQWDDRVVLDSAGTHAYHSDSPPDPRGQKAALARGYDISKQRARPVVMGDFDLFDHIFVMDESKYARVMEACPKLYTYKIRYFLDFIPDLDTNDVPDPYYGGYNGFERVLDLIEEAVDGLFEAVKKDEL